MIPRQDLIARVRKGELQEIYARGLNEPLCELKRQLKQAADLFSNSTPVEGDSKKYVWTLSFKEPLTPKQAQIVAKILEMHSNETELSDQKTFA